MKCFLVFTILALNMGIPTAALAQDVDDRTRGVGGIQDAATNGDVMHSFDTLPRVLDVGQWVRVRDETGRTTRGKVLSISGEQLVVGDVFVGSWSFKQRREERIYAKNSVTRIDIVDSAWNGAALGAAVGIGALVWSIRHARATDSDGTGAIFYGVPAFTLATTVGALIDRRINRPVYQPSSQTPQVTLAPLVWPDAMGISAHLHF